MGIWRWSLFALAALYHVSLPGQLLHLAALFLHGDRTPVTCWRRRVMFYLRPAVVESTKLRSVLVQNCREMYLFLVTDKYSKVLIPVLLLL